MNSSVIYNAFGTEIKKKEDGSVSIDISSHLFWFAYCVDRPAVSTNHIAMVSGGLLSPILLCVVMERLLLRVSVCLPLLGSHLFLPFTWVIFLDATSVHALPWRSRRVAVTLHTFTARVVELCRRKEGNRGIFQ